MSSPKVLQMVEQFMLKTSTAGLSTPEAAEIFMHCICSVALDAGRGDKLTAVRFLDEVVQPWINHARAEYAKGGHVKAEFIDGKRVN